MLEISDDILTQAAQGDLKSFEMVYRATSGFVYNVALRVVGQREDAQEVVQEVFLIVHRQLKNFRFESSLKTWLYRITVNCAVNFARKNARNRNQVEYADYLAEAVVPNEMQGKADKEHYDRAIEYLLNAVNPEQRACVVLRSIEGLSYQQIAETLKINIGTVRSRLKRAREKMLTLKRRVNYGQL